MKRLIAVLSGLLVLPAFAEIAPAYYYEELMAQYESEMPDVEFVDDEINVQSETTTEQDEPVVPVAPTAVSPRNQNGRAAASRAMASGNTTTTRGTAARNVTNATTARVVTSRPTVVARPTTSGRAAATANASRTATASRTGTSRANATNTVTSRPTTSVRSTGSAATQGLTTRNSTRTSGNTARASIVQTDTVNTPLYISSRVGVNNTSNVTTRVPTIRVGTAAVSTNATSTSATSETTSATTSIDELAQLTDYCKAQYVACMDNFCNVLDDNQGRCSCSANLDNYAETEAALKQATEDLQDVALQIQYIGLTADEVETLFTQTEAELEMQTSNDNSQLKNDLDKIKNMIIDVKSGTPEVSSGMSFDLSGLLDFTIDSTGFDLSSLLGSMSGNNDSISNQRGKQLYETAAARCKAAVLNSCSAQGVDTTIITNSYDLEIDKACIQYERALTDSNEQMSSTVRNAKSVLQRARLLVAQQKNQYDLRGCVNALDTCMQDDFVCGDDYGKYIVNGEVVVGSEPGAPGYDDAAIYDTWDYGEGKNAWGASTDNGSLSEFITSTVIAGAAAKPSTNISEFLQNKIGYHDDSDGKDYGMCMSILNRCQDVTYEGTGQKKTYKEDNNVIKEFLNRTLVQIKSAQDTILAQIKSAQDTILADYAENCITDVASCLAQNNYDADQTVAASSGNKLAIKACNPIITTCMSVNDVDGQASTENLTADEWIEQIMGN